MPLTGMSVEGPATDVPGEVLSERIPVTYVRSTAVGDLGFVPSAGRFRGR